jgi:hypothetical protein
MRRFLVPLVGALIAAGIVAGLATAIGPDNTNSKHFQYAIGLWGDLPYSDLQAQTGVPNLIKDMNASDIEFSVHDGDLKAGNGTPGSVTPTTCIPALYTQALGYFNSLDKPAIFTPGDNDWTDCDRASNGGVNSLGQLDYERQVFFGTDKSLGEHPMKLEVQSTPECPSQIDASTDTVTQTTPCSENRRWTFHDVTYATFDIQGSCNNLCDTAPDPAEEAGRTAADIEWLHQTFQEAEKKHSAAVMLISQADPGFEPLGDQGGPKRNPTTLAETDASPDGFHDWLVAVRDETTEFGKPVVYVHGDSHYFKIDKPLVTSGGKRIENFTRLETFGDNQGNGDQDVDWVKVLVDPHSRDVFAFQPQIVPENQG